MIGPTHADKDLHDGMTTRMTLRDIAFLDREGASAKFLGRIVTRVAGGFDTTVRTETERTILQDVGLGRGGRAAVLLGLKDVVINDTRVRNVAHGWTAFSSAWCCDQTCIDWVLRLRPRFRCRSETIVLGSSTKTVFPVFFSQGVLREICDCVCFVEVVIEGTWTIK